MADDKVPYHERYKAAPPPDYMRYLTAPFEGYWKRQGNLAREGLAMAEDGAQRARGGDMSGYLGAVLGPLNYLTSPINALLPEEQATRDFGRSLGGSTGEALAASGLGLAAIAMPGPDVGKGAKFADEAAEGITAYHGSPHTFDKFDMSKIGTGEGAQAYGHGLYFAENEGVAKSYRDALAKPSWQVPPEKIAPELADLGFDPKALELARDTLRGLNGDGYQAVSALDGMAANSGSKTAKEAASAIRSFHRSAKREDGSMYQVRLNVKPDELLDWDKPLSEQPESVRGILKGQPEVQRKIDAMRRIVGDKAENMSGQSAYAALTGWKQGADLSPTGEAAVATSQKLKAAGIKGIRYKDAGSRGSDGGTYNYVIFDDSLVSILKRYAIPFTLGAGGAAMVSGQDMPPELAAQMGPEA